MRTLIPVFRANCILFSRPISDMMFTVSRYFFFNIDTEQIMHQSLSPRRDLTAHYCLYQTAYFAACAGYSAFAVTYLMGKGFAASEIGVILAMTNILSCLLQPLLGDYADRHPVSSLQRLLTLCIGITFACAALIEGIALAHLLTGALYLTGGVAFSLTVALSNSLCASYAQRQYHINYGVGAGIGSIAFSFASLGLGFVLSRLGSRMLMVIVLLFLAIQMALALTFPRIRDEQEKETVKKEKSLSLIAFARRYKNFMLTLCGVMLIGSCHMMSENFMINLFQEFGGTSENVGTALFLACTTAAPALLLFERIQRVTGIEKLMRICGVFYVLKMVLMALSSSILSVYLIELMQTITYVFLFPPIYYFARERIAESDVAKGQTVDNALYTFGVAIGNSVGGAIIDAAGVRVMLVAAAVIALTGMIMINVFIGKKDV